MDTLLTPMQLAVGLRVTGHKILFLTCDNCGGLDQMTFKCFVDVPSIGAEP
jgi:hypothetical protein